MNHLYELSIDEISIIFHPSRPSVPGAVPLIIKGGKVEEPMTAKFNHGLKRT